MIIHHTRKFLVAVSICAIGICAAATAQAQNNDPNFSRSQVEDLINDARRTVRDVDDEIGSFRRNLREAVGILVFPRIVKAGFLVAVEGGSGVMLGRYEDLRDPPSNLLPNFAFDWSAPAFFNLAAGSFGFQVGASGSQVILLFMTPRAFERALDGDFEIGAEIRVTVVNEDSRDRVFDDADVLSYALASGLFAGIAFEGAAVNQLRGAHDTLYGERLFAEDIVTDAGIDSAEADRLRELLTDLGSRD